MSATETKKKEAGMAQLVLVLFAISAITALLLGLVNSITADAIAANQKAKIEKAMNEVLPASGYTEVTASYAGGDTTVEAVYEAEGEGYVVQVSPAGSFSGTLTVMVGVTSDGACSGISIVKTSETSGLGANASKDYFREQFQGLTGTAAVTKDNGTIEALTGATITSRAVCSAVNSAVAVAASMG